MSEGSSPNLRRAARLVAAALIAVCAGLLAPGVVSSPARSLEPPRAHELARYRADGSLTARLRAARRLGDQRVSAALVRGLEARLRAAQLGLEPAAFMPPPAWRGMPTTGTVKILTLLVSFKDYPSTNSADAVRAKLFGAGSGGYPYESLHDYYRRSSYSKLDLQGDVLGWWPAPFNRTAVSQTDAGREHLIEQALDSYKAQGYDFSPYDNDHDGAIDYLVVVWTGPDTGWAGFWWGYQTTFSDTSYTLSGKHLGTYSWQWESNPAGGPYDPKVVIHETGHALGLPDYYDYDDTAGPGGGLGGLDMMDAAWGDHNCFSKFLLDWITPQTVNRGANTVTLGASATVPEATVVMPDVAPGDPFAEFFMVQNRDPVGNDSDFPGAGLLIWHVDARLNSAGTDFLYDNSYTAHKLLRLMEADGREDIEKGLSADAGDYYGVAARLAGDTVPNSRTYAGSLTGVAVSDISAPGPAVSYAAAAGAAPDTTPPVTVSSADDKWHRARVTIRLTATDAESGVASTRYKLDGHAWTSGSKLIVAAPHDHSNDGVHNLRFRSTDKAGNVETAKLCHVRIDTLGPVTLAPVPVTVAHGAYATLPYRVNDNLSPTASVSIRVKKADGVTVKTMSVSKARANTSLRKRFLCGLAPGTYRFFIYAHDLAGNAQTVLGSNTLTVH